jgi:hypothetical protein
LLAQPEQEASVLLASCGVISGVCAGGVAEHGAAVVEAKALGPLMRVLSEDKERVRSAAAGALDAVMGTGVGWSRDAIMGLAGEGCVDALCEALIGSPRGPSPAVLTGADAATSVEVVALTGLTKMLEGVGDTGSTSRAAVPLSRPAGKLVSLNPPYHSFLLCKRETTVGRKPENNVVINHPHGAY